MPSTSSQTGLLLTIRLSAAPSPWQPTGKSLLAKWKTNFRQQVAIYRQAFQGLHQELDFSITPRRPGGFSDQQVTPKEAAFPRYLCSLSLLDWKRETISSLLSWKKCGKRIWELQLENAGKIQTPDSLMSMKRSTFFSSGGLPTIQIRHHSSKRIF